MKDIQDPFLIPATPKTYHVHDGVDEPRLDPRFFLGFPILSAVPTEKAEDGTFVLVSNSGNYYFYAMIDRAWRGVQLPL